MEEKKQKPAIRQQAIFSELFAKISSNCCNDNPIIFVGLLLMPSFENYLENGRVQPQHKRLTKIFNYIILSPIL
jgi:hypothetical protein